jgi:hypothetical protein
MDEGLLASCPQAREKTPRFKWCAAIFFQLSSDEGSYVEENRRAPSGRTGDSFRRLGPDSLAQPRKQSAMNFLRLLAREFLRARVFVALCHLLLLRRPGLCGSGGLSPFRHALMNTCRILVALKALLLCIGVALLHTLLLLGEILLLGGLLVLRVSGRAKDEGG